LPTGPWRCREHLKDPRTHGHCTARAILADVRRGKGPALSSKFWILMGVLTSTDYSGGGGSVAEPAKEQEGRGVGDARRPHNRDRGRVWYQKCSCHPRSWRPDRDRGRTLAALGREEPKPDTAKPKPAVPVRRQDDHLLCPVCGKQQQTLRRHLDSAHQLAPAAYREQFGLKPYYPMAAPATRASGPRWRSASAWVGVN
jgi:ROS/MUCR transcriptional regulator protein